MATQVRMPKLGWTMEEGTIANWCKQEGETVEQGEPLLEVITDKVTIEVEAPASGILQAIKVQADETVPVETVIALIAAPGEVIEEPAAAQPQPAAAGQPADVVSTPVARRLAAEHGVDLAEVSGGSGPRIRKQDIEVHLQQKRVEPGSRSKPLASPAARRLAREHKVDLATVPGTSREGAVLKRDVERYLQAQAPEAPSAVAGQRIPLSRLRKIIGQRMQQSLQTAPHFTLTVEVDMTEAEERRKGLTAHVEKQAGCSLSATAFLVKATAMVLHSHPFLNAVLDGDDVVVSDQINIGVAVASKDGLLVPVIRETDRKGLVEIAATLNKLTSQAREQTLSLDDISSGGFTISNLGMFGIDQFTAIINPPQSAILAVGRIVRKPVFVGEEVVGRLMMNMTLSADHRIVDGAVAGAFLTDLRDYLENPDMLLL